MAKKTYDECYEIAKRYSTKKSFRENEQYAYGRALRNDWLKDYTWLSGAEKYSYEECRCIAEKYNIKKAFPSFASDAAVRSRTVVTKQNIRGLLINFFAVIFLKPLRSPVTRIVPIVVLSPFIFAPDEK